MEGGEEAVFDWIEEATRRHTNLFAPCLDVSPGDVTIFEPPVNIRSDMLPRFRPDFRSSRIIGGKVIRVGFIMVIESTSYGVRFDEVFKRN